MPDWREILSRDGPAAWRTAYRIVGNSADADECLQEACLAAWNVSRRQPVHNWRALLKRLATTRAIDRLRDRSRRRAREEAVDGDWHDAGAPLPAQRMEDEELIEQLRSALAQIPPKQAELFCLYLDQWSYQEIADQLDISTSRVGVLLHRAREKLARILAATLGTRSANDGQAPSGRNTKRAKREPS